MTNKFNIKGNTMKTEPKFTTETTRHPSGELITDQSKNRDDKGNWKEKPIDPVKTEKPSVAADFTSAENKEFEQKKEK